MNPSNTASQDLLALLKSPFLTQSQKGLPSADELPLNLEAVQNVRVDEQNIRLGKYVEQLFDQYLQNHPEVRDLKMHIQVNNQKKTLGEIDYLFSYQGKVYHWELSQKYYLLGSKHGKVAFYGPQGKDRLDSKAQRMLDHQLPLIQLPQIEPDLPCPAKEIYSQAYIKGCLFYNPLKKHPIPPFPLLNPGHTRGFWQTIDEFKDNKALYADSKYIILDKTRWLTPLSHLHPIYEEQNFSSCCEILSHHFKNASHCKMVLQIQKNLTPIQGMIVCSNWAESPSLHKSC